MNDLTKNPHIKALLIIAYIAVGYYFITKWLPNIFIWFLPFILAYYIAYITQPFVRLLSRKFDMPNKASAITALTIYLLAIGSLLGYVITRIITELMDFAREVPTYLSELPDFYRIISINLQNLQSKLPFMTDLSSQIETSVGDMLKNLSKTILSGATDFASKLPSIGLFLIAFLISCFFITIDYSMISGAIKKQFTPTNREKFLEIKGYALTAVSKYLKGIFTLMLITFAVSLAGLLVLQIKYSYLIAILLGLLDALPLIGTGILLIPWGIFLLISGNFYKGIGLLALCLVIMLVRQFAEPKVMGKALGLYPLATLIAIYVGLKIYGFWGAITVPIIMLIAVFVYKGEQGEEPLPPSKNNM